MMNKLIILFFLTIIFFTTQHSATELQIYADSIDYDSNNNLIAKGNAKIIRDKEIITSNLVIINETEKKIILPLEFKYKDENQYYYSGSSGEFSTDFENGIVNDYKMLLDDGSRVVGTKAYKTGKIDLIEKGVFSPCNSKIRIKNFICPIWQVEGEKILHDREKLFLYQKHAKMRIFNIPVYYLPYLVTPSPLRKKRKSGFLNPTISTMFLGTKTSQMVSFPYYYAIDQDKELTITPTINYGGGVDASQQISYEYDQILSGGHLSIDVSTDTNLENENNENWLRDASIIIGTEQNLNENYKMSFSTALQSSPTYLRRTDQNNFLNRSNSLRTNFSISGYEIREPNDKLDFGITGYQVVRNNEDNKTTPTTLPYTSYTFGDREFKNTKYKNKLIFYNIFRDTSTADHAQKQQKIEHSLKAEKGVIALYSDVAFKTELYTQFYHTENKKIDNEDYTGNYSRIFPMTGLFISTPLVNKKFDLYITPKIFGVLNSGQSNSNKISNEESTDVSYSLLNFGSLSRYTGTDKLENSRRLSYGIDATKDRFRLELGQSYEFDTDRNAYMKNVGLDDYMSSVLGLSSYKGKNNDFLYTFRLNVDQGLLESQSLTYDNENKISTSSITYSQSRKKVNSILESDSERLGIGFGSKTFFRSSVNFSSAFDLIEDEPTSYKLGYSYLDECFGITIDFDRSFYADRDLKPKDLLTIMFKFKHLGSYKSTNLAVSEQGKQDIQWDWSGKGGDVSSFR